MKDEEFNAGTMKIYIASSWKNEGLVLSLAKLFRTWGHEVDCFADVSTGRYVFHWSEIGDRNSFDAISFLNGPQAKKAFAQDKAKLDWADCVVLVLPSGRSAHLEAGYAKGQGKKLYIIGDFPKGEFDVMYGFADGMYREILELQDVLQIDEEN